jgi:hypothetical protein
MHRKPLHRAAPLRRRSGMFPEHSPASALNLENSHFVPADCWRLSGAHLPGGIGA